MSEEVYNPRRTVVLHVKPRMEKRVFALLEKYGCWRYLPLWTKVTKVQRRRVKRILPLFPGYVFSYLNSDEKAKLFATDMLVKVITVPNPRQLVRQLHQISRASRLRANVKPVPIFKAGEKVRIAHGPFRGMEGIYRRIGAFASLVINVDMLGQAVEVSVDPIDVEKSE